MSEEQFLKIAEAQKLLNVKTASTILKAIAAGEIKAIKIGAQWRIPKSQFND